MTALIPDPVEPGTYIVGNATDSRIGANIGATVLHNVHSPDKCAGQVCIVHNPTDHHMRNWRLTWRGDRGIFERHCPEHGVGHPDPDDLDYWERIGQAWQGSHGCCGCCRG